MQSEAATTTRGARINSAFLREVEDDISHVHDLRIAVRALIDNPLLLQGHAQRLATLLERLRDQLAMHFAFEEAYGCLDDAVDVAPRLSTIAERLRSEHAMLYAALAGIAEDAQEVGTNGFPAGRADALAERIRDLDGRLTEHESQEARLILEAMNRDIGGEG